MKISVKIILVHFWRDVRKVLKLRFNNPNIVPTVVHSLNITNPYHFLTKLVAGRGSVMQKKFACKNLVHPSRSLKDKSGNS